MNNCVDPDQMPRTAASDLGLHSLFRLVCPNAKGYYGICQKKQSFRLLHLMFSNSYIDK